MFNIDLDFVRKLTKDQQINVKQLRIIYCFNFKFFNCQIFEHILFREIDYRNQSHTDSFISGYQVLFKSLHITRMISEIQRNTNGKIIISNGIEVLEILSNITH